MYVYVCWVLCMYFVIFLLCICLESQQILRLFCVHMRILSQLILSTFSKGSVLVVTGTNMRKMTLWHPAVNVWGGNISIEQLPKTFLVDTLVNHLTDTKEDNSTSGMFQSLKNVVLVAMVRQLLKQTQL